MICGIQLYLWDRDDEHERYLDAITRRQDDFDRRLAALERERRYEAVYEDTEVTELLERFDAATFKLTQDREHLQEVWQSLTDAYLTSVAVRSGLSRLRRLE